MSITQIYYVFVIILPVFLLIGLGYIAFKFEIISKSGHGSLSAFVFNFALPAAIFSELSSQSLSDIWNSDYIFAYAIGSLITFFIVIIYSRLIVNKSIVESGILGLGGCFSNSLLIGFPIVYFLLGNQVLIPFSLTLIVENLILLPFIILFLDVYQAHGHMRLLERLKVVFIPLRKNPIILSIAFGMLFSAIDIQVPSIAINMIDILANTVSGVALFSIGGGLVGVSLIGVKHEIGLVVVSKLLIHPLVILCVITGFFELDANMIAVAVILASMPMFGIYSVIGQKYNMGEKCSAILLSTTLFSLVTISVISTAILMTFSN